MTRIDVAEKALAGIFEMERAAGRDAGHLGTALRLVVGAWMGHGFSNVLNDLEVARNIAGFETLYQHHLNDMKARGLATLPDRRLERQRSREQFDQEERDYQARRRAATQMDEVRR